MAFTKRMKINKHFSTVRKLAAKKSVEPEEAWKLAAIQVYRPQCTKQWFQVDPLVNKVKEKSVCGVKSEVVEALALSAGGVIIWRISGITQCAEDACELENARVKNISKVRLSNPKVEVDPVKLRSTPNRIVTRSFIDVLALPLLELEKIDPAKPNWYLSRYLKTRAGPKSSKARGGARRRPETSGHRDMAQNHGSEQVVLPNSDDGVERMELDESANTEVVIRPPPPSTNDVDEVALGEDLRPDHVEIKDEPSDDDGGDGNLFGAREVAVKRESAK